MENNGSFLRGHYRFTYYGHDYITLNEDLSSWTAEGKAAQLIKQTWETHHKAEHWRTYLQGKCVEMLRRCLDLGKETLLRSGKRDACRLLLLRVELLSPKASSSSAGSSWNTYTVLHQGGQTAVKFPDSM